MPPILVGGHLDSWDLGTGAIDDAVGVAIATALVSAMTGRMVRRDVAMTGEITLRGRVLPIGGVKEKVLGAHRAGIRHIVLPRRNQADLEDVPAEVRAELEFHLADTLSDVLAVALVSADKPETQLALGLGSPSAEGGAAWGAH